MSVVPSMSSTTKIPVSVISNLAPSFEPSQRPTTCLGTIGSGIEAQPAAAKSATASHNFRSCRRGSCDRAPSDAVRSVPCPTMTCTSVGNRRNFKNRTISQECRGVFEPAACIPPIQFDSVTKTNGAEKFRNNPEGMLGGSVHLSGNPSASIFFVISQRRVTALEACGRGHSLAPPAPLRSRALQERRFARALLRNAFGRARFQSRRLRR